MIDDNAKVAVKQAIDLTVTTNGNEEITGSGLNVVLTAFLNAIIKPLHIANANPPTTDRFWIDNTTTPYTIKFFNGVEWTGLIPEASVKTAIISSPNGVINIPEGRLLTELIIIADPLAVVSIGTTMNGIEYVDNETITNADDLLLDMGIYFKAAGSIYVATNSTITIKYYIK